MSALDLIDLLEEKELLSARSVQKLRRQVQQSPKSLSPAALAKLLVKKELLTERMAKKLLVQLKEREEAQRNDDLQVVPDEEDESDLMPVEEDDEPELMPVDEDDEPELMPLDDEDDDSEAQPAVELDELEAVDEASDSAEAIQATPTLDDEGAELDEARDVEDVLDEAESEQASTGVTISRKKRGLAALLRLPGKRERKKVRANRWDSPLLLVGGGALLLLVFAAIGLYYYLFRGTGDDVFALALDNYRQQSYGQAISQFERFLSDFPDHPKVSQARVTIGLAKIRSTVERKRWEESLEMARQELGKIENEEAFGEARPELASLLPEIMEGFADQALAAEQIADAQRYLDLANEAFEEVNNSAYLPTSVRQGQQQRIEQIQSKLEVVKHRINEDKELSQTVAKLQAEASAGRIAQAYELRKSLLKKYPRLETDPRLEAAVHEVTRQERESVSPLSDLPATFDSDHASTSQYSVVLAYRQGETAPSASQRVVLALAQGAAYALKADSGDVLWRRFVGIESTKFPIHLRNEPGADVLVVDQSRGELVRLKADSGELIWRLGCGADVTGPVVVDQRIFVGCGGEQDGRLVAVDAESGAATFAVSLPTGISTGPAPDVERQRIVQPGAHSSLYVLAIEDLSCKGVYYLGHAAGSIDVPPIVVQGHLVVAENPGPDFSLIHVLATDPDDPDNYQPLIKPMRLQGRIVVPMHAFGRRLLVATDQGQIHVLELDPQNPNNPVRETASASGTVQSGTVSYPLLDEGRLWVADNQLSRYELQTSRGQLVRKWINSKEDTFIGPLQRISDTLFHVRKQAGRLGVTVAAVRIDDGGARDGETIWQTEIGVPPAGEPFINRAAQEIDVVSSNGALFALTTDAIRAGIVDQPKHEVTDDQLLPLAHSIVMSDERRVFVSEPARNRFLMFDPTSSGPAMRVVTMALQDGQPAAEPVEFRDGLLVATKQGPVYLLDAQSGRSLVAPFQPPLQAGTQLAWLPAAVAGDGTSAFICDRTGRIFRLSVSSSDPPQLIPNGQVSTEFRLVSRLETLGQTLFGTMRRAGADVLMSFDADLRAKGEWDLAGRVVWGPRRVDDQVLVVTDADELLSLSEDDLNWKVDLPDGPIAGPPLSLDGGLVWASIRGTLFQLDRQTGAQRRQLDVGEPLGTGPVMFPGNRLMVCGGDGTVLVVTLPSE